MKNIIITIIAIITTITTFAKDFHTVYTYDEYNNRYSAHTQKQIEDKMKEGYRILDLEERFEDFCIKHPFSTVTIKDAYTDKREVTVHTYTYSEVYKKVLSKENPKSNNVIFWSVDKTGIPVFHKKPQLFVHHRYVFLMQEFFEAEFNTTYSYENGKWNQTVKFTE